MTNNSFDLRASIEDLMENLDEDYLISLNANLSDIKASLKASVMGGASAGPKPQVAPQSSSAAVSYNKNQNASQKAESVNVSTAPAPSFDAIMAMFDGPKKQSSYQSKDQSAASAKNESAVKLAGLGNQSSRLVFVGDKANFEGASGELFDKILSAMKLSRKDVFLLFADELFDKNIFEIISPRVIVALGEKATQLLLKTSFTLSKGNFHRIKGTEVLPTYSPQEILKDSALKKPVWDDLKKVLPKI